MTLIEARRYAVSKKTRIEFRTADGTACVVDEHGVARVPGLTSAPPFVLTEEFGKAGEFTLVRGAQRQVLSRAEFSRLAGPVTPAAHAHDEEE